MPISVFDLFKIGVGPSSSHTVGPMQAAFKYVTTLRENSQLDEVGHLEVHLYVPRVSDMLPITQLLWD